MRPHIIDSRELARIEDLIYSLNKWKLRNQNGLDAVQDKIFDISTGNLQRVVDIIKERQNPLPRPEDKQ